MLVEQMRVGSMAVFSYIVGCEREKEGLIIDPAGSEDRILSNAENMGLTVKYVVNTHGHADHTCGNRAILARTGAQLVVHEDDAQRISSGFNKIASVSESYSYAGAYPRLHMSLWGRQPFYRRYAICGRSGQNRPQGGIF